MIRYICSKCDNLICESSICPVCNSRTFLDKSEIYYCDQCNIPLFDKICPICGKKANYMGTDVRPVFPEERLLLEAIEGTPFKYANKSIWNTTGNNYFVDGQKIKLTIKNIVKNIDANIIRKIIEENQEENKKYVDKFYEQQYIKDFIKANSIRLNSIVTEAHEYIKDISKNYNLDSMFVSFSGGKDSTVTSDLVMSALGTDKIIHIYGDTTLEYPETGVYLEKFKKAHPTTP